MAWNCDWLIVVTKLCAYFITADFTVDCRAGFFKHDTLDMICPWITTHPQHYHNAKKGFCSSSGSLKLFTSQDNLVPRVLFIPRGTKTEDHGNEVGLRKSVFFSVNSFREQIH